MKGNLSPMPPPPHLRRPLSQFLEKVCLRSAFSLTPWRVEGRSTNLHGSSQLLHVVQHGGCHHPQDHLFKVATLMAYGVPRPGIGSEPYLQLMLQLWQHWILSPTHWARDRTCFLVLQRCMIPLLHYGGNPSK